MRRRMDAVEEGVERSWNSCTAALVVDQRRVDPMGDQRTELAQAVDRRMVDLGEVLHKVPDQVGVQRKASTLEAVQDRVRLTQRRVKDHTLVARTSGEEVPSTLGQSIHSAVVSRMPSTVAAVVEVLSPVPALVSSRDDVQKEPVDPQSLIPSFWSRVFGCRTVVVAVDTSSGLSIDRSWKSPSSGQGLERSTRPCQGRQSSRYHRVILRRNGKMR